MKTLRRVGLETGVLTLEEYQWVDEEIVKAIRPMLIGRRILETTSLAGKGIMQAKFYTETDMSQAQISMFGKTESDDKLVYDPTTLPVPVIAKEFVLNWRDVLAARRMGEALDVAHARNAARQVAEEEDKLLLSGEYTGWPAMGIEGLSTATGRQSQATAGAWPANAFTDINAARALLQAVGFVGSVYDFILVGPTALIKCLDAQLTNTEITYRMFLLNNNLINAAYESDSVFAADGGTDSVLLVVPGKDNFDVLSTPIQTNYWEDKHMNTYGKVFETVVPRIKRPTSIVEITGVSC